METLWGREACTHPCIHPLIHSYLPQLFTESPRVGSQLGTAMQSSRLQPSLEELTVPWGDPHSQGAPDKDWSQGLALASLAH